MDNAMNELWRAQQDAATRLTESWRGLLQPPADRAPRSPVPPTDPAQEPADPNPGYALENDAPEGDLAGDDATDSDTTDSDTTGEPEPEPAVLQVFQAIQSLGEGQRDFAEHMARWAEQQRDLADAMSAWADRQREYAAALDRLLSPLPPRG